VQLLSKEITNRPEMTAKEISNFLTEKGLASTEAKYVGKDFANNKTQLLKFG
jgi:hypothetical protein